MRNISLKEVQKRISLLLKVKIENRDRQWVHLYSMYIKIQTKLLKEKQK